MFEALERAQARAAKRLRPQDLKPVEIRSVADIKTVLLELDPKTALDGPPITISTDLVGEDETGTRRTYRVSAPTRSKSKRTMLLEGMEVVKRHQSVRQSQLDRSQPIEINGRQVLPPMPPIDSRNSIDPLIRQWLGGSREGLLVTWDLHDGYQYRYDIFEHKLTRAKTDQEPG